jgi:hypothetical protein
MTNIVERATQISQQAEEAEPLLSHQLYDTVRKFTQDTAKDLKDAQNELLSRGPMTRSLFDLLRNDSEQGAAKLEEITSEMLRLGFLPQAGRMGERARSGIENLKKGVERAAESVLGDDTEELRLAQRQLDDLASQLGREIAEGQGKQGQTNSVGEGMKPGEKQTKGGEQASSDTNASSQMAQASGKPANQQSPGQGRGQQASQNGGRQPSASSQGEGSQEGSGPPQDAQAQSPSSQPGKGSSQPGEGSGPPSGSEANQPGEGSTRSPQLAQNSRAQQPGRGARGSQANQGSPGANGGDPTDANLAAGAGGGGRNWNWEQLRSESARRQDAPITGEDFSGWSDRLREVEELIDEPDLRDNVAKARERARLARQDFKQDRKKPDWAVLQLQVMKPLTEVRDRIADELARRESRDALVPLDRDPVPNRYSDLVRRYYEGLGKDK